MKSMQRIISLKSDFSDYFWQPDAYRTNLRAIPSTSIPSVEGNPQPLCGLGNWGDLECVIIIKFNI
jgi:hypothetical protein